MTTFEKIKKMATIALGFALATYFIMSGMAMLEMEEKENNTTTQKVEVKK